MKLRRKETNKACLIVEQTVKEIFPEGCVIEFNPSMNEVKVSCKKEERSIDYSNLFDALEAWEREKEKLIAPKVGTVFDHNGPFWNLNAPMSTKRYVITSIESTEEEGVWIWALGPDSTEPDSWGTVNSYSNALKENLVKVIWEPKS
jgi:hypothetical protein